MVGIRIRARRREKLAKLLVEKRQGASRTGTEFVAATGRGLALKWLEFVRRGQISTHGGS